VNDATVKPGLIQKLAAITSLVSRIPKRGRNEFHKYDYATEADVSESIRQHFADANIMLIGRVDGHEQTILTPGGADKAPMMLSTVRMTFTLFDGDSGERLEFPWIGAGSDKGDKGIYKALTGAEKYFLLKLFLIPTGDDPERDDAHQKPAPAARPVERHTEREPGSDDGPAPEDGEGVIVSAFKRASSKPDAPRPWKAGFVTFSDGTEAGTFDAEMIAFLEGANVSKQRILYTWEPSKKDPSKRMITAAEYAERVSF
jgi:hypothetical protein